MDNLFYSVNDVQQVLNISRTKAYDFIKEAYEKQSPFPVVRIGTSIRVPKAAFDDWLVSVGAIVM